MRTRATIWALLLTASLAASGCCNLLSRGGPPQNAVQISVIANTSLAPWLQQAVSDFNDARVKVDKRPIYVNVHFAESGCIGYAGRGILQEKLLESVIVAFLERLEHLAHDSINRLEIVLGDVGVVCGLLRESLMPA